MFDGIGNKIKAVSRIMCWIGIFFSALVSLVFIIDTENVFIGLCIGLGGALVSWLASLFTYGVGEIIDRLVSIDTHLSHLSHLNVNALKEINRLVERPQAIVHDTTSSENVKKTVQQPETTNSEPFQQSKPLSESVPHCKEEAAQQKYTDNELEMLNTLLSEGQLTKEEYQDCLNRFKH